MLMMDSEMTGRDGRNRKGIATVELAVCLPVMVILVLGFIEVTNAIYLKERLTAAAYEGARKVTAPSKTTTDGTTAAQNVIDQFGIHGGTITITPNDGSGTVTATTTSRTQITVKVEAPLSSNSCMKPFIIGQTFTKIQATAVMSRQ